MAIYTIDGQSAGPIISVPASKIKKFGGGSSGSIATPATVLEAQSQTSPTAEENKYITLYNIWKYSQASTSTFINPSSSTATAYRLRSDGNRLWFTNGALFEKTLAFDENGVNVPQILISSASFSTTTKDVNNISQNGKSVIVDSAIATTITISTASEANFVAVYVKYGAGNLTFTAGSGVTLIQYNGTNIITENARAALVRVGTTNTFILYA